MEPWRNLEPWTILALRKWRLPLYGLPPISLVPQTRIFRDFSARPPRQPANLPKERGNYFLSPLPGMIPMIFKMSKMGAKKTGNLFLVSCLGVPFYTTAVILIAFGVWLFIKRNLNSATTRRDWMLFSASGLTCLFSMAQFCFAGCNTVKPRPALRSCPHNHLIRFGFLMRKRFHFPLQEL